MGTIPSSLPWVLGSIMIDILLAAATCGGSYPPGQDICNEVVVEDVKPLPGVVSEAPPTTTPQTGSGSAVLGLTAGLAAIGLGGGLVLTGRRRS